jgi:hypothetical protein
MSGGAWEQIRRWDDTALVMLLVLVRYLLPVYYTARTDQFLTGARNSSAAMPVDLEGEYPLALAYAQAVNDMGSYQAH